MTGVGPDGACNDNRVSCAQRPEVVLEASHDRTFFLLLFLFVLPSADVVHGAVETWHEIHFAYKPGAVNGSLPIIAPHQPRLDWQMWFAALSDYTHQPWFVHLAQKLLKGSPDVYALLPAQEHFSPRTPPKIVRAVRYLYSFTRDRSAAAWWQRTVVGDYLPAIGLDNETVDKFLEQHGWTEKITPACRPTTADKRPLVVLAAWLRLHARAVAWLPFALLAVGLLLRAVTRSGRDVVNATVPVSPAARAALATSGAAPAAGKSMKTAATTTQGASAAAQAATTTAPPAKATQGATVPSAGSGKSGRKAKQ